MTRILVPGQRVAGLDPVIAQVGNIVVCVDGGIVIDRVITENGMSPEEVLKMMDLVGQEFATEDAETDVVPLPAQKELTRELRRR